MPLSLSNGVQDAGMNPMRIRRTLPREGATMRKRQGAASDAIGCPTTY